MSEKPIVVTTERGVFFGYVPEEADLQRKTLRLARARMCIYWPKENHGVLGLAADGPKTGARISPAVPGLIIFDITMIMECSVNAVKAWESEPWS